MIILYWYRCRYFFGGFLVYSLLLIAVRYRKRIDMSIVIVAIINYSIGVINSGWLMKRKQMTIMHATENQKSVDIRVAHSHIQSQGKKSEMKPRYDSHEHDYVHRSQCNCTWHSRSSALFPHVAAYCSTPLNFQATTFIFWIYFIWMLKHNGSIKLHLIYLCYYQIYLYESVILLSAAKTKKVEIKTNDKSQTRKMRLKNKSTTTTTTNGWMVLQIDTILYGFRLLIDRMRVSKCSWQTKKLAMNREFSIVFDLLRKQTINFAIV